MVNFKIFKKFIFMFTLGMFLYTTVANAETAIKVDNVGNVGIGTPNPAYKLDVAGTVNSSEGIKIGGVDVSPGAHTVDTKLNETDVDNYVSNNGYLSSESDPTVNDLGKAVLSCGSGQVAKRDGTNWVCGDDDNSGGDITAVNVGHGLSGGAVSGDVDLAVDTSVIQSRVGGVLLARRLG